MRKEDSELSKWVWKQVDKVSYEKEKAKYRRLHEKKCNELEELVHDSSLAQEEFLSHISRAHFQGLEAVINQLEKAKGLLPIFMKDAFKQDNYQDLYLREADNLIEELKNKFGAYYVD